LDPSYAILGFLYFGHFWNYKATLIAGKKNVIFLSGPNGTGFVFLISKNLLL
jgi:hypothetical protein